MKITDSITRSYFELSRQEREKIPKARRKKLWIPWNLTRNRTPRCMKAILYDGAIDNIMKHKKTYIQDISQGMQVNDMFIVTQSRLDQAKNGPYWQLTLQDRTGTIPARIWSPASQGFEKISPEQIVNVRATAQSFRDQLQLNIDDLEFVPADETSLAFFLPVSATPPEELHRQLLDLLHRNIAFPPWAKLAKNILGQDEIRTSLINAPGGKSIHHAYIGGLLEHTLDVCRICLAISELYPDLDQDVLLVGAALHDLGKSREISSSISRDYSDQGKLLGHIFLGLEMIQPFVDKARNLSPELILHLKHIILSHHGELEFGSPKRPKTKEAFVLHFADNLDAKMNTLDQALKGQDAKDDQGPYWSEYQRSLARFLYSPARTPRPEMKKKGPATKEARCLLPLKG
ncbi:3'-5' exoribonuclease YhaM family protein [Desulfonatronovibrio hydrogenovorans]|uniref:3'-5' exoribonuclease YhaM family protein n=1 Tax=Desulfonatronovibrio hydrogenovorans TaxID=53245 RepID=UPI00307DA7E9